MTSSASRVSWCVPTIPVPTIPMSNGQTAWTAGRLAQPISSSNRTDAPVRSPRCSARLIASTSTRDLRLAIGLLHRRDAASTGAG